MLRNKLWTIAVLALGALLGYAVSKIDWSRDEP